jgi:hypothetical protein
LQIFPLPQLVPLDTGVHTLVLEVGTQALQASVGLCCPLVENDPPMKHPTSHAPAWQTLPDPQLVPSPSAVKLVVLDAG